MSYTSKKSKFIASTITAAVVASAVAPAAGFAASNFKDVPADSLYADYVNALATAKIIDGRPDGSFDLGGKVTRGEASKMVANILKLDTDKAPVADFSDVDQKKWYAPFINALFAEELINGKGAGKFDPNGTLTRGEFAKMVVEAYDLKLNEKGPKANFKDVDGKKWYAEFIEILYSHELVSGTSATTFSPNAEIKRADFAKLLASADWAVGSTLEKPAADKVIESVKAVSDITVNEGEEVVLPKTVEVVYNDETTEAVAVAWNTKDIDFAKVGTHTVTGNIEGTEKTASVKVVVKAVAPKVVEVSAVNAKQVLVKFNKEVGTGATTVANYAVTTVTTSLNNPVTNAVVQADGKSVLLTLTNGYRVSTDIVVAADNIYLKDSIKETFARFSNVVTVNDTVVPTIESVKASTNNTAAQAVTVKFSEPIDVTSTVFKVNGVDVTATTVAEDATITDTFIISGQNLAVDNVHTLEVLSYKDFADNSVSYSTESFSVTKDSVPATGQVKLLQDNKVQITFDKAMNLASLNNVDVLYYNAKTSKYEALTLVKNTGNNAVLTSGGKVATFTIAANQAAKIFGLNDTTEELLVKVKNGVVDSLGNAVSPFEQRITTNEDITGPVLETITFDKNSRGEVSKLYFHFNEELAAAPANTVFLDESKLVITDTLTNAVVASNDSIFGAALATGDVSLATDGKTVVVTPASNATNKLLSGTYSFKFVAGELADTSFGANTNLVTSATSNFGATSNTVVVSDIDINETAGAADNIATVTFSKAVSAASAKNPANYSINGVVLPSDTVITIVSDTQVKFQLPEGTVSKTDASAVIRVTGIQPQDSSSSFVAYVGTENLLDNTAPVATGILLSDGTIQFSFTDGGIVTPDEDDFVQVKLNGKLVSTTATYATTLTNAVVTLPDGKDVVTVKVEAKNSVDHNSTGFTYQYIDVDGDGALDFTKDIVLQSVAATSAPSSWTSTADLNLLLSVEVITGATTATADDSTYDADGVGAGTATNKLKAEDILKVK